MADNFIEKIRQVETNADAKLLEAQETAKQIVERAHNEAAALQTATKEAALQACQIAIDEANKEVEVALKTANDEMQSDIKELQTKAREKQNEAIVKIISKLG